MAPLQAVGRAGPHGCPTSWPRPLRGPRGHPLACVSGCGPQFLVCSTIICACEAPEGPGRGVPVPIRGWSASLCCHVVRAAWSPSHCTRA